MSAVEMPSPAALLSIREASQLLNLCENSVWNHAAPRGTLPVVRIGSRLLFRREDIERWIESRVVRPDSAESLVSSSSHPMARPRYERGRCRLVRSLQCLILTIGASA